MGLKTLSLSMMKNAVFLLVFGQNLSGHWFKPMWSLESVFVVHYMHVLHFVCLCPHFWWHLHQKYSFIEIHIEQFIHVQFMFCKTLPTSNYCWVGTWVYTKYIPP
jgi:hypothetical protein